MKKILLLCLLILACKDEIHMAMKKRGLPKKNDKNFEIIEPPTPSITEFLQNTEHREAVESELALSIEKKLREVEKATVSLNKDTTAFVKIKLRPTSKGLNENEIENIKRFVASAIDELKAERVWVLDDKRNELSDEKSNMARLDTYNADGDADVAEVTAYLRENKYEYKLIYNGCITILVPKESLKEIRMALEKEGFPKNLKNISIVRPVKSITEFLQNPELRQALEKELSNNIKGFSEAENAVVSINKDTTATVKLKLHPSNELNENQIKGIQYWVASEVDELKAERVSVLDKWNEQTEIEYETIQDPRDNKTYKTAKIGEQIWMAENLNYNAKGSRCYNDSTANCEKYGRLYNWKTAMKVCPKDWHLPNNEEWNILMKFINPKCYDNIRKCAVATKLKATSGWNDGGNGTNDYGFSALPSGYCGSADCHGIGSSSLWWSSTESNSIWANYRDMRYHPDYYSESVPHYIDLKKSLLSVRCVRYEL
jgi:uncharacterized protein (TIGR02145 family)